MKKSGKMRVCYEFGYSDMPLPCYKDISCEECLKKWKEKIKKEVEKKLKMRK